MQSPEQVPFYWAVTQRNLSIALKALAKTTSGEDGKKLADEAAGIDRQLETLDSSGGGK